MAGTDLMSRTVDVHISKQHGDACTCHRLDPIVFQPVIVTDGCPGRNLERLDAVRELFQLPTAGRLVIEWPPPSPHGVPLYTPRMRAYDYDTGAELTSITGLRIDLGGAGWNSEPITADLTMLVNADGLPLAAGEPVQPQRNEDGTPGTDVATGVFRYEVMEMRVAGPVEDKG